MNKDADTQSYSEQVPQLQDEVLTEWLAAVRHEVKRAELIPEPILVNTMPMFYKHLAALASKKETTYEHSTIALEHGGERARMTSMDIPAITQEFQLLRRIFLQVWNRHGITIDDDQSTAISLAIDNAIRESITGFVLKEASYREQFFAALTHDLRTPLGTAGMAIDLIKKTQSIERTHQLAFIVERQHGIMAKMIEDLLDTMSLKSGDKKNLNIVEVDLCSLTSEVIEGAKLRSGRVINLIEKPVDGYWSKQEFRRAIENLISNAIKYSHPNSPITVEIEKFDSRVTLMVKNFGAPIPPENIEGLFQIFRRGISGKNTDNSLGWGVGLAYVRSVVEQHGGSVVVQSNATETCFALDFPLDARLIATSNAIQTNF